MTDTEKLEALVRRAVENGFEKIGGKYVSSFEVAGGQVLITGADEDSDLYGVSQYGYNEIIFNHDFARALFEDWPQIMKDSIPKGIKSVTDIPAWQYHLQQAVISEDLIDYMYKAVFGDA